jgi:hypothetical protein
MRSTLQAVPFALVLILAIGVVSPAAAQSVDPEKAKADMAAMMEKAKRFTQPGEKHQALERFIGTWTTETRFFMAGKPTPAEKGTASTTWLIPGRWLKSESSGTMMGRAWQSFVLLGYDNFKQSYVMTTVSNMDTAMSHAEGDIDPATGALIAYGTIDEYLTGEHDKMVRYVWRFPAANRIVLEVHDLPIGEANTKVVEIAFTRK